MLALIAVVAVVSLAVLSSTTSGLLEPRQLAAHDGGRDAGRNSDAPSDGASRRNSDARDSGSSAGSGRDVEALARSMQRQGVELAALREEVRRLRAAADVRAERSDARAHELRADVKHLEGEVVHARRMIARRRGDSDGGDAYVASADGSGAGGVAHPTFVMPMLTTPTVPTTPSPPPANPGDGTSGDASDVGGGGGSNSGAVAGTGALRGRASAGGQRRSPGAPVLPREFDELGRTNPAEQNRRRREAVRDAFREAWRAYQLHAWGRDELKPRSRMYHNWGRRSTGLGLTIFDAMSTLAVMDLGMELAEAMQFVVSDAARHAFDQDAGVSVFEVTIRVVGSLLSTYELTGERHAPLLGMARMVADKLLAAYNTSSGLPHQMVNLRTRQHWNSEWLNTGAVLSEFGSVQLEMRTLSFHLRDPLYDMAATHVMAVVHSRCAADAFLCPTIASVDDGQFRDDTITLGALGDSYFEYLVKQFALTGGTEPVYGAMAQDALDAAATRLLRHSRPGRQAYFVSLQANTPRHEMDHLACFAGGMYALAASTIGARRFDRRTAYPKSAAERAAAAAGGNGGNDAADQTTLPRGDGGADDGDGPGAGGANRTAWYMKIAASVTSTCHEMYARQDTGLAPENVLFANGGDDFTNGQPHYLQRPEALESMFYLWRATHDVKYRKMAWDIFTSIRHYCRAGETGGYQGVRNVNQVPVEGDDRQQSFFLAETLKYLFLIFSDDGVVDLSEWVLNTEAHPLRIRRRDPTALWRQWEAAHGGVPRFVPPFVQDLAAPARIAQLYETDAQRAAADALPHAPREKDPLAIDDPKKDGDDG
jgi:mannosyl-oligosaccharide alpha-1,2-mannosidase